MTRNVAFVRGIAYERGPEDPFASCLGSFMLGATAAGSQFSRFVEAGGTRKP